MGSNLSASQLRHFLDVAISMADEANKLIDQATKKGFKVFRKEDGSYVTDTDRQVEQHLRRMIADHFPDHGVLGEEFTPYQENADFQWILDPIDGTEDFIHRIPTFGTIIALHYRQRAIVGIIDHAPLQLRLTGALNMGSFKNGEALQLNDLAPADIDGSERIVCCARANFLRYGDEGHYFDRLTGKHPNHRIYRTCLAHSLAITGSVDAMVEYGNHPWDLAASQLLIEEAGGKYTRIQSLNHPTDGLIMGAVFGKPSLVDIIASYFQ